MDESTLSESTENSSQPRLKLGLIHCFYPFVLLAVGLALSPLMVVPTIVLLIIWLFFWKATSRNDQFIACVLVLSVLLLSVYISQFVYVPARNQGLINHHNIHELAKGITAYQLNHGPLLANELSDKGEQNSDRNGNPFRHSWRVKIMPYLDQGSSDWGYDFNEPWNGPNNIKLLDQVPPQFQNLSHGLRNKTAYKIVTGPGTISDQTPDKEVDLSTIVLVEDVESPVYWTEPDDFTIDQALTLLNQMRIEQCAQQSKRTFWTRYFGIHVVTLDGAIHLRSIESKKPISRSALTISKDDEEADLPTPLVSPVERSPRLGLLVFNYLQIFLAVLYAACAFWSAIGITRRRRSS